MEGTIVEKLECRPYADQTYMNMKALSIRNAAQPKRQVQQLDKLVTTFKPISDHKHNVRFPFIQSFFFFTLMKQLICFRLSMTKERRQMARNLERTKMLSWICCLMPLKNINFITSRI